MHQKPITESPRGELVLMLMKQSSINGTEGLVSSPALRMSLGPTSHGHERKWAIFGQWMPDCKRAQFAQEFPRCSAKFAEQTTEWLFTFTCNKSKCFEVIFPRYKVETALVYCSDLYIDRTWVS